MIFLIYLAILKHGSCLSFRDFNWKKVESCMSINIAENKKGFLYFLLLYITVYNCIDLVEKYLLGDTEDCLSFCKKSKLTTECTDCYRKVWYYTILFMYDMDHMV